VEDKLRPLRWDFDGQQYAPTTLCKEIFFQATGTRPNVWGTRWWVNKAGQDLVEIADQAAVTED
jgi:hypothetical protein